MRNMLNRYLPFSAWLAGFIILLTARSLFIHFSVSLSKWHFDVLSLVWIFLLADMISSRRKTAGMEKEIRALQSENWRMEEEKSVFDAMNIATREVLCEAGNLKEKSSYINTYLREILGYSEVDIQAKKNWWESNLHPSDREIIAGMFNKAIKDGQKKIRAEYRFRCKDGSYKVILDNSHIFGNTYGNTYRIISCLQDITEYKNLEEKISIQRLTHEREMKRAVVKAQDIERQRLSAELHDNINQLMLSARLFVNHALKSWKLNTEEKKVLHLISGTINQAFNEIRNLSHMLSISWCENSDLIDSINNLCSRMMQVNNFHIHIDAAAMDSSLLNSHQKHTIYRIVQEQLTNIVKHAKASSVTIALKIINAQVIMEITDNGRGFDVGCIKRGIGLHNMQQRIESCQGKLDIISEIGKGTHLKVAFNIAYKDPVTNLLAPANGIANPQKIFNEENL